jgi:hypothetical protein
VATRPLPRASYLPSTSSRTQSGLCPRTDEVDDVDRLVALDLGGCEVLFLHEDVLAPLEPECLDDLLVPDGLVLLLADLLVADRAVVLLVHEVELELVQLLDRAVQARTGTLTSPDDVEPDQIERGMLIVIAAMGEGETLEEIDRLFALPLDEFTSARNELARRLKQAGDAEAAEAVRGLAKPTVAAWAVNQLARREPEAVRALLNVAARLRSAQERALGGERAADSLRAAQSEEREVIRDLTRRAEQILRQEGRTASGQTLERVSSTLRAAAVGDPGRETLREGRLSGDVEVSGFDAFAGLEVPRRGARGAARASDDDLTERRRLKREAERRRKELEKRVRDLSARAQTAERDAQRARKAADEAEAIAEERRREAEEAAAELAELGD